MRNLKIAVDVHLVQAAGNKKVSAFRFILEALFV